MKAPIDKFGPHTQVVLREMCSVVGADPTKIDFGSNDWFWEYAWTKEQEQKFTKFVTDYLYNNTAARREIMQWPRKTKKNCESAAKYFVWNYGWKTMDIDEE
jgi:hypothetical protein